jgi:hypothetical protein
MHNLIDKIESMEEKAELRDKLLRALMRSLTPQELWSEAFTGGGAKSQVTVTSGGDYYFTITSAAGDTRVLELVDVPRTLWPANMPDNTRRKLSRRRDRRKAQISA